MCIYNCYTNLVQINNQNLYKSYKLPCIKFKRLIIKLGFTKNIIFQFNSNQIFYRERQTKLFTKYFCGSSQSHYYKYHN